MWIVLLVKVTLVVPAGRYQGLYPLIYRRILVRSPRIKHKARPPAVAEDVTRVSTWIE